MYKVGDEVSVKGEITKVCESGVVVKAHYFGEAYFDRSNMDLIGKTYEQGLADAWELARKICALKNADFDKVFGCVYFADVFFNFTTEEALAKIEAYESEKAEIKVGDLVEYKNTIKAVVTRIENSEEVYVLWGDGSCGKLKKNEVLKNGETAEGLSDLLRQVGE